jgi:hypothetical protein
MPDQLLLTWIAIGAAAVVGYFIIKHLILSYMARGGPFRHSGSDGAGFSSHAGIASGGSADCGAGGAACGDGGGGGGGDGG